MAETDTERADHEDGGVLSGKARTGAAIAAVGIVTSGLALNFLTQLGAPGVGTVVFVTGFVTTIAALWYVLLRPLDLGAE
ncbi:hypothetical protein [Halomarina litorea]|uniref:hypothetical protein n=1 Tax=Halomarina litorea TaxID=2961595 RepID=UPI0020C1FA2E|nr:hypothetical protein [Halomarina sp. BCD28]